MKDNYDRLKIDKYEKTERNIKYELVTKTKNSLNLGMFDIGKPKVFNRIKLWRYDQ